jgi:hypothetical protein
MSRWVTGLRDGELYTIAVKLLDPRWSQRDVNQMLAWCATGQHLGWSEDRAFQAAEAMLFKRLHPGIQWPFSSLTEDIRRLEETTLARGEL